MIETLFIIIIGLGIGFALFKTSPLYSIVGVLMVALARVMITVMEFPMVFHGMLAWLGLGWVIGMILGVVL